jgi:hypothetical protein
MKLPALVLVISEVRDKLPEVPMKVFEVGYNLASFL